MTKVISCRLKISFMKMFKPKIDKKINKKFAFYEEVWYLIGI